MVIMEVRHHGKAEIVKWVGHDSYDFADALFVAQIHDAAKMRSCGVRKFIECSEVAKNMEIRSHFINTRLYFVEKNFGLRLVELSR